MKNFDDVFKIYNSTFPATKAEDHKPNQVREKYAEIIEAAGLDGRLLRIDYSKETRTVSECLKSCTEKTAYVIPDESMDFVVSVIKSILLTIISIFAEAILNWLPGKNFLD